jgi:RNA polymerase sigma factor (sigma-70 family)
MSLPPFELLYLEHRDEIFGLLVRRLGRQAAEDAFQETFLRALRAYPDLGHGRHLRAWLFTIAARVAIDAWRRARPLEPLPELAAPATDGSWRELVPLTDALPPAERSAVVLRYGFDLPYREIGAMLGTSEAAARQAASAGVKRLRMLEER